MMSQRVPITFISLYCHFSRPRPQAKELVEGAPCTILAKVKKEDAAKIIEKLKAETGAELEHV